MSPNTPGLQPSDIDIVLLTHGHPDHVGGLTIRGEPVFTGVDYSLPKVEFGSWTQDPASVPAGLREMIKECRRHLSPIAHGIRSYSDGDEIAPGVFVVAAHRCRRASAYWSAPSKSTFWLRATTSHFQAWVDRAIGRRVSLRALAFGVIWRLGCIKGAGAAGTASPGTPLPP